MWSVSSIYLTMLCYLLLLQSPISIKTEIILREQRPVRPWLRLRIASSQPPGSSLLARLWVTGAVRAVWALQPISLRLTPGEKKGQLIMNNLVQLGKLNLNQALYPLLAVSGLNYLSFSKSIHRYILICFLALSFTIENSNQLAFYSYIYYYYY